ncbi:MAG: hypothetical protein AB1461_17670 [Thermodesulfobacteriota bacterium]
MKLPETDAKLFFQLMWALQFYVNQKFRIHDCKCLEDYAGSAAEQKFKVREALYQNVELFDSFVQENPQNFSTENLAIISGWKKCIKGSFFIERLRKEYAVFIKDDNVYGVLGITQSFDELIDKTNLPIYVDAVLLPFRGGIVYDGLLQFRNIFFGGGIKRNLKETYLRAKQNNRIIVSLEKPGTDKRPEAAPAALKNWEPELEALARQANKLKGSLEHPAIYTPAFSLVKASIEFAQCAVSDANDRQGLDKALKKVRRAYNKSSTVLFREEF